MVRPVYDESKIPRFNSEKPTISEESSLSIFVVGLSLSSILIAVIATTLWLRNKSEDVFEAELEEESSD